MSEELTATEQVVEPAIAPEPTAAPEVEATAETPEPETQEPPKDNGIAKRFSTISRQRDEAKAEADYWRQQAIARQQEPEPAQQDFGENPFSEDAITAAVQRALAIERQNAARQEAQNAQAQKAQTLQAKLYESGLEGAVLIASGADIPFSPAMIDALAVSEHAAQVAHHLGTNPAEAARIAGLPPQLQGYELAKLEGRLASQPRTTNAPPPPSTVGARGNPAPGPRDDMSTDDWRAARRAQRAAGR